MEFVSYDIEANDFQYVEIKLKSDKDGGGEFSATCS